MIANSMADVVEQFEGLTIDYHPDGTVLLDRSGQNLAYLTPETAGAHTETAKTFFEKTEVARQELIKECEDPNRNLELVGLVVNVSLDMLSHTEACDGIAALLKGLSEKQQVRLAIYFDESPKSFEAALESLYSRLRDQIASGRIGLIISGPFRHVDGASKEYLMERNARLLFQGDPRNVAPKPNQEELEAIYSLADFGFRVPVAWQVHSGNVNTVREAVDDYMFANYNSGFALPLISHIPYNEQVAADLLVPSSREYLNLLVEVYRDYPFYDDVLYPVASFATSAYRGGVCFTRDVPRSIQLLVSADGDVKVFGHTPALAASWMKLGDVLAMEQTEVYGRLMQGLEGMRCESLSPTCRQCQWKNLCGGECTEKSLEPYRVHCDAGAFFFRVLLWQRSKVVRTMQAGARRQTGNGVESNAVSQ